MTHSILRLPAVKARTGLPRSTIYKHIADGNFPKPIPLGDRAVGWIEADINAWIEGKIKTGRDAAHRRGTSK